MDWDETRASLRGATLADLLALNAAVLEELRERGVLRSANNPTGDLAEYLFASAFDWKLRGISGKSFDAVDGRTRYQIKGRRLIHRNSSPELSAIRDLGGFDILAAVLFDAEYCVMRAALIPATIVQDRSRFVKHTNSHRFILHSNVWDAPGVEDVTDRLRAVQQRRRPNLRIVEDGCEAGPVEWLTPVQARLDEEGLTDR